MKKVLLTVVVLAASTLAATAQSLEKVKYGDFQQWITRNISESSIIGGADKTLYEIGPTQTINGNKAYNNLGGSPWATSNVYAKVMGISKGSNAVFPDNRAGGNKCAKLTTIMEQVKALGVVDLDVLVSGSIYLGKMCEPVKNTSNPYSKLEMGVPFNKRPKNLVHDYRTIIPAGMPARCLYFSNAVGKTRTATSTPNVWLQDANAS